MTQAAVEITETAVVGNEEIQDSIGDVEERKEDPTFFPESIVATAVAQEIVK